MTLPKDLEDLPKDIVDCIFSYHNNIEYINTHLSAWIIWFSNAYKLCNSCDNEGTKHFVPYITKYRNARDPHRFYNWKSREKVMLGKLSRSQFMRFIDLFFDAGVCKGNRALFDQGSCAGAHRNTRKVVQYMSDVMYFQW